MEPRKSGRIRRLVVTGVIGAAVGGGVAGVALASTGSGAAAATTTATTSTSSSSSGSSSSPSTGSSSAPQPGATHHCTNMGSSSGTSSS